MPYEPHGDPTGLLSGPRHVEAEGVGVLAAELEDVADLDAAADLERRAAAAAGVAGAHLGGGHDVGGLEVAAHDDVDGVLARLVGPGAQALPARRAGRRRSAALEPLRPM
jgi:hypothetical protein